MQALRDRQARKAWQQRLAEPVKRPRGTFEWGKGARILMLAQTDDAPAWKATTAFAQAHRAKGFDVSVLGYASAKTKAEERQQDVWGPHVLGFARLPKAEFEAPLRQQEYDLVVHAGLQPFAPFDYLAAGLSAHRRVCAYDGAPEAYDLIVGGTTIQDVSQFLKEAVKLLQLISPSYA